jgi:hypothetical protein
MKNTFLPIFILLSFSSPVISQADTLYHNAYERFEGAYEDVKQPGRKYRGFKVGDEFTMTVILSANIYKVVLKWPEKLGDSIIWHSQKYVGNYAVTDQGIVTLLNDHPFRSKDFTIAEKVGEMTAYGRIMHYTFSAVLKRDRGAGLPRKIRFSAEKTISRQQQPTYGPGRYLPHHKAYFRALWSIALRDSVPGKLEALQPEPERSGMPTFAELKNEKMTIGAFYVDSIVFDTLYISRIQVYMSGPYQLKRPLKIIDNIFIIKEGGELYKEPDITGDIIYERDETHDMENLKLLEYCVDSYGLQWVRVEFDVATGHPRYPELEHYDGWILQGALEAATY